METRRPRTGLTPGDAALDWMGVTLRTPGNDKQASSIARADIWKAGRDQKSPFVVTLSHVPRLRAGCAGFASGCRLDFSKAKLLSGGCPASCPDARQPTRDHRHVRNWAEPQISPIAPDSKCSFKVFLIFPQLPSGFIQGSSA